MIPFANVLNKLKEFYRAAEVKLQVDEQRFELLQEKLSRDESDDEMWERVNQEVLDREEEKADINRKNQELIIKAWEKARERNRDDEARYWKNQLKTRKEFNENERKLNAAYWDEVRKAWAASQAANQRSQLSFGLL